MAFDSTVAVNGSREPIHLSHKLKSLMQTSLKTIAAVSVVAFLTACDGGGGGDKDLFSLWTRDGDSVRIELTGGALSTPFALALFRPDGAQCNCTMTVIGTQQSGSVVINQCFYVTGSAAQAPTPACSVHNSTGSYTKTSDVLTLTGPNGTANFR